MFTNLSDHKTAAIIKEMGWPVGLGHYDSNNNIISRGERGRLLLRTPGPVPLGLAYVLLVETNPFSELVVIFRTMLFEYPSVLSRFCFESNSYECVQCKDFLLHIPTVDDKRELHVELCVKRTKVNFLATFWLYSFLTGYLDTSWLAWLVFLPILYTDLGWWKKDAQKV